jgi:hypothetical protein
MDYTVKRADKYEVRLYIGSREGYNGPVISFDTLKESVKDFQIAQSEKAGPVRITRTTFVFRDYEEDGYEIGMINYPRKPLGPIMVHQFAMDLAAYLLERFKQNRISIEFPDETCMLEADNAEVKHR